MRLDAFIPKDVSGAPHGCVPGVTAAPEAGTPEKVGVTGACARAISRIGEALAPDTPNSWADSSHGEDTSTTTPCEQGTQRASEEPSRHGTYKRIWFHRLMPFHAATVPGQERPTLCFGFQHAA